MTQPAIVFDGVWKKFRRGERHDSLRDLIPSLVRRATARRKLADLESDEFWVLRDISFEVRPGEVLGIIGQNGAGKSTTLKLLTKLLKPTKGRAAVHGRVGALIEVAAGFHPDLTGRENVFLQGAIMGMRRDEILRRFDEIVAFSGLETFIDTPVKRYSSGMNARLGFSIAAHLEPDVLLIDEVLAVGDFTFQQKCYERLRQFRRAGTAIAFVSHNMQAVASLCDRAMLLRHGQPPLVDDVARVTAAYAHAAPASSDPRIVIRSATLRVVGEDEELARPVSPGTRLVVDLEFVAKEPLPQCGVGVLVTRGDGLEIFRGASNIEGQARDVAANVPIRCSIEVTANVLRGMYTVAVFLLSTGRLWPDVLLSGLVSFVTHETSRISGCAELYPSYSMACGEDDAFVRLDDSSAAMARGLELSALSDSQ